MQVRQALEDARMRERNSAAEAECWVGCRKTREGFAERFLAIWHMDPWEGGSLDLRLEKGNLKVDVLRPTQTGEWEWVPFAGWQGYNLATATASARSRSPPRARAAVAAPKAMPKAAAAAPKALAKAVPKAKALPKAAPGAPKPPWPAVVGGILARDRIVRNGITYFHARRIIVAMGLRNWEKHLTEKIPMCKDEFGWVMGNDYLQESGGRSGIPPYWLSSTAALSVYQCHA
jgi:hypothetical protein